MNFADLPVVGTPFLGGTFAGIVTVQSVHYAVGLVKHQPHRLMTWSEALHWTRLQGVVLMPRPVASMVQASLPSLLDGDWHWMSESPHVVIGMQHGTVVHIYDHETHKARVRGVRLVQLPCSAALASRAVSIPEPQVDATLRKLDVTGAAALITPDQPWPRTTTTKPSLADARQYSDDQERP